jgi:hypothetical protein
MKIFVNAKKKLKISEQIDFNENTNNAIKPMRNSLRINLLYSLLVLPMRTTYCGRYESHSK